MATWIIDEFNHALNDWASYMDKVEFYFEANGITDASKKLAWLLSFCGALTDSQLLHLHTWKQLTQTFSSVSIITISPRLPQQ